MKAHLWRRLQALSLAQTPPETIALTVVLGLWLGVCPVYGAPTLLCAIAAFLVRPHVPLLQVVNLATSPLQFALLLPFRRAGAWVVPLTPHMSGGLGLLAHAGAIAVQTVTGWALICAPLGLVVCAVLMWLGRRRAERG